MLWSNERIRSELQKISADAGLRLVTVGPFVAQLRDEYEARIAELETVIDDLGQTIVRMTAQCRECVEKLQPDVDSHIESIVCPNCNHIEQATVLHTAPFYSYVHNCTQCCHIIMESEWQTIEQMIQECTKE